MTPAEAMTKVVRAYHREFVPPESETELSGIYYSLLHGKHTMLRLDNAASREQVEPLLPPQAALQSSPPETGLPCRGSRKRTWMSCPLRMPGGCYWRSQSASAAGRMSFQGYAAAFPSLCATLPTY